MTAWVKIHIEKFIGAIPISIVEAVHGQSTRVLTIAIAVELESKHEFQRTYNYFYQT
jgi:hypothetical protein